MLEAQRSSGAEIPFELASSGGRRGRRGSSGGGLCVYRALTSEFVRGRWPELMRADGSERAIRALEGCHGLERYVASRVAPKEGRGGRGRAARLGARGRAIAALQAFTEDVFDEQSDFELKDERFAEAFRALDAAAAAEGASLTLLSTLHGVTLLSGELPIARGLTIATPDAIAELPEALCADAWSGPPARTDEASGYLVVHYSAGDSDESPARALAQARAVLNDLLIALRLFGDGRIAYGPLAWARLGGGPFRPVGLGGRTPRPRRSLVVTEAQEDELRAFCNLVSRRAPRGDSLAWALGRFELGCSRAHPYDALSDHLLALQALLDPERQSHGLLAARVAALCAAPEHRQHTAERVIEAIALEHAIAAGEGSEHAGGFELARELGDWLKALLSDVICGHLDPDLKRLADELLLDGERGAEGDPPVEATVADDAEKRWTDERSARVGATRAREQETTVHAARPGRFRVAADAAPAPDDPGATLDVACVQESEVGRDADDPLDSIVQGILPL